jgi:hypothetical protein
MDDAGVPVPRKAPELVPAPDPPENAGSEVIITPIPAELPQGETPTSEIPQESVEGSVTLPAVQAPAVPISDFSDTRWRAALSRTQWMPGHRDRFGMFSLVGESGVAWENWGGLMSTSGYGFHFLNGPVSTDLPSKVFDFTWGLAWNGELTDGWSASLAGKVGIYADFEDSVRDGWRFPAHAVVFHDWTDTLRGAAGVKYLDRESLNILPVLGVILRPDDRVRIEALFPEPRIAWRVHADDDSQNWISISGEIGGGEWAIERSNSGLADVVTYNDYSAVLGFHNHTAGGPEQAFEIGYVFARDLEYRSGVGDYRPPDTFFIRLSGRF